MSRHLLRLFLPLVAAFAAACGSIAPNVWEVTEQAPLSEVVTIPTRVPPTATLLPPTATPPPTATLIPTATFTPSAVPATATLVPSATAAATSTAAVPLTEPIEPLPAGFAERVGASDPAAGQTIFVSNYTLPNGQQWACSTCHSVTPDEARLIGPGLWNLGVRAETRIPGTDGLTYIYNSIRHPNQYIVPADATGPYPPNLMPAGYAEILDEQEFANLIAYLETLQ